MWVIEPLTQVKSLNSFRFFTQCCIRDTIRGQAETKSEKNKAIITLTSIDNQLLGAVAAKIRSLRKPEPKGKGIKFVGEQLRRKAGKTAAS